MKMSEMFSDTGEDMGGGGGAGAQPAPQAPAPTTAPAGSPAAPWETPKGLDTPSGNDAFFGGVSDAFSAPPTSNLGPSTPTPTESMAPGIPADPFGGAGGIAGQTSDPLAFAPYTPPSTTGAPPATTPDAPVGLGDAQMAPDTSGFTPPAGMGGPVGGGEQLPPVSVNATPYSGPTTTEQYGQDYGTPAINPPGPAQMGTDFSSDLPQSPMSPFEGGWNPYNAPTYNAPTYNPPPQTGGFTPTISSGLPPDQTQPLGNDQAMPWTPPDQRGPAVPTYQPPAYIPPDTTSSPVEPPPIEQPTDVGYPYNAPTYNAPTNPVPVASFVPQIASGLPAEQTQPLGNDQAMPWTPPDERGPAVPTYQPPAYIPPDTVQSPVEPPPIERPTDVGYPQNSPADIAPTLPPVSVSNPTPPETPAVSAPPAATVLPGVPEQASTPVANAPTGTPTPAATTPPGSLPAATQTALTTQLGGLLGPEQGAVPPVSVNGLTTAPASSMITELAGNLGGANAPATATPPAPLVNPIPNPGAPAPVSVTNAGGIGGTAATPFTGANIPTTGSAYAPQTTAVTPENTLTNQQISVAPTADRFALAQQKMSDFVNQSNPAYQAALREATQRSAAAGGLGSGMLRTSYGNAELARENQMNTAQNQFLTNALEGTIGDAYKNADLATQQQGFQNTQQQDAFRNQMLQQELANQMQQQGFNQAMQQLNSGSTGSPADMGVLLSQIFGNQATGSANAAGQIAQGVQGQQNAQTQQQMLLAYLNSMGINPQGTGATGAAGSSGGDNLPGTNVTGNMSGLNDWLSQFGAQQGTQATGPQQTTFNPNTGQMEYVDQFATEDPLQQYSSFGQAGYK